MADDRPGAMWTDAAGYERFMGRWSRLVGRQVIDWLAPPPGLAWLDAGCGTGAFTELLLRHAAPGSVVGFDPAPDQVAHARAAVADRRASFAVGDATGIDFPDDRFDAAIAALVLNFIPARDKAVAELARVVRPGGTVAAYVWDFAGDGAVPRHLTAAIAELDPESAARYRKAVDADSSRPEALAAVFRGAGLVAVDTRPCDIECAFADIDDYWGANTTTAAPNGVYVSRLAADAVARLKAALPRHLPPPGADGAIRFAAKAWAVKGQVAG